jgi:elongator complex protein 4
VNLKYCILFTEYSLLSGCTTVLYPFIPEEDKYGTYAKLLIKYFLAEGIVSGHSVIAASQDYDCETLVCYV